MAIGEKNTDATRTQATTEAYERIARRLFEQTKEEFAVVDRDVDPREVAARFLNSIPYFARATVRFYRAALVYEFSVIGTEAALTARDMLTEPRESDVFERAGTKVTKRRTSAMKAKRISEADLFELITFLKTRRSAWRDATRAWLFAGGLTGLRPKEWVGTKLTEEEGCVSLTVKNAKATNGRAHGETRTIHLSSASEEEINVIKLHWSTLNAWAKEGRYDQYVANCRKLLERTVRRLWPNRKLRVSLYTLRHKFCSDAKSVYALPQVAAVMGHASMDTARHHYGKRRHGTGRVAVKPAKEDVAAVLQRNPLAAVSEPEKVE